jgi:hypothetical protein
MCKYISKFWINVGFLLFLAATDIQAITLTYQGVDTQNQTLVSEIKVIAQVDNLFFLRIIGGMPDTNTLTKTPYIRVLQANERDNTPTQAAAVFSAPFLYVFALGTISRQKLIIDVNYTYVFLQQDEKHFQLSHYFREGESCQVPSCTDSDETHLFCGEQPICQPLLEKISFDELIIYDINLSKRK